MNPSIYITPEGIVSFIADCPEEPKYVPEQFDKFINHTEYVTVYVGGDVFGNERKKAAYEKALAAAKQYAIRYADQDATYDLFKKHSFELYKNFYGDTLHDFPSDRYRVEVKESWFGTINSLTDTKVAILIPLDQDTPPPESQERYSFTKDNLIAAHAAGLNQMDFDEWYQRYIDMYRNVLTRNSDNK